MTTVLRRLFRGVELVDLRLVTGDAGGGVVGAAAGAGTVNAVVALAFGFGRGMISLT